MDADGTDRLVLICGGPVSGGVVEQGEGDGFPKREPRLNVLAAAEGRGTRLINHRIIACINAESIPRLFAFLFSFLSSDRS
jgi:hypothetical protein